MVGLCVLFAVVGARNKDTLRTGTKNIMVYCRLAEFRKMLWRLPPIHFGREDGVERTLLRVACQSETFLAPPWQGGIDIRVLWHIGCQSDFDELVSMASRPVDRGFGRMAEPSRSFRPVKSLFGRMAEPSRSFHPVKSRFGRMGCSQQKTPFGRTFPFLTKWFPPLSRGWHCPQGVLLARRRVRRHHFATRKTPLNTSCVLRCSTKGAT